MVTELTAHPESTLMDTCIYLISMQKAFLHQHKQTDCQMLFCSVRLFKSDVLVYSAAYQNMSALKDAILSFTPVTSNPLLHKYFIGRLLFF